MAKGKLQFTLLYPLQQVLAFLSDPGRVGECLAFVEKTVMEPKGIRWKVNLYSWSVERAIPCPRRLE